MHSPPVCRAAAGCVLLVTLLGVAACREEGGVKVTSLKFEGVATGAVWW